MLLRIPLQLNPQIPNTSDRPNRRPIANIFRKTAHTAVRWCVANGVSPDTISWLSVIAAMIASLSLMWYTKFPILLLIAALFCAIRLWFNMLDGMVAIASGKTSKKGEIVNEFPDRISDVLIFVGIAHSHSINLYAGYWAAIGALFTAYIGILSQAASAPRQFGGLMSKPWRMVLVMIASVLLWGLPGFDQRLQDNYGVSVYALTCWIVVAGCLQTTLHRYRSAMRWLDQKNLDKNP